MADTTNNKWIHDWNRASTPLIPPGTRVLLNDETLRDGLQNPSVHDPTIEEKIEILHLMESLGIDSLNIGLPGAGPRAVAHTEALDRTTEKAVKFAIAHNLPSMYVTEDTIRTDPETVKRLYSTAISSGARAIVLCDTVGHATPQGAYNLIKFAVE